MQPLKRLWKRIPNKPRRILTLILGILLILTAGLIGWVPGPGGTIVFLLGIAVLATEFMWAERLRDQLLLYLKQLGNYIRQRPLFSGVILSVSFVVIAACSYLFYTRIR